ncbi:MULTISPECIES: BLUF domain-containing protein [Sphingomonas]|uniref:BLUF domain-containing protein n=1 Tax=Sphingomonas TaxID=13687 RepID=UPI000DEF9834|nr:MULTISPECIES: BLUF domain-containing protein [Sphingomonas]
MDLLSLTYTSQAVAGLNEAAIERILHSSQGNNALDGITGFLLFDGAAFVQVLEGAEDAVDDLLARIKADPRHRDLEVSDRRAVAQRAFPDWTMGYLCVDGTLGNAAAVTRALDRDTPPPVRALLARLAGPLGERG